MAEQALRKAPLGGFHGGSAAAHVTAAGPASRLSLRAGTDAVTALSKALGLDLPTKPKTSASSDARHALWLGPDEWLLIDENGADLAALAAKADVLHSAVDVSHRNTAVLVAGTKAAAAIASASPHDLSPSVFPVGACARTVLGKIEVVIFRTGEQDYRVECWRSFAPYAFGLLAEGAEDAGL
ncbi:sarcosine oxidase subunit gamma [Mycoplana rhizolycopersici]|uniref:Sarcosine oxidase subunit gamma n=1 Tax=Mycoplana rhizolycopersici TaxID=2746702 RepID=A0ABX2QDB4_9HYPH|nr:sarcosine oxidase subunit gamma [Rhizobium rhizolycopersici]NVP55746.1 sarcosine oxidase subunit gamma [Rhizobium rhizolycopersici]